MAISLTAAWLRDLCRTLVLATAGGALFWILGLPAPWLAGSMVVTTAAALSGYCQPVPDVARNAVFVLIGIQIGAAFTPEAVSHMARWPLSLALLGLTVVAVTLAGYQLYRRLAGWSRPSAFFASCPGALSMTLILADSAGAHLPSVTVVQCMRVFFLVLVLPLLISMWGGGGSAIGPAEAALPDVVVMLIVGLAGAFAAERLRAPAGLIVGPMASVAAVQLAGVVAGAPPAWMLVPGFVVFGLLIGARFSGVTLATLKGLFALGLAGFMLSLGISAMGALAASMLAGVSPMAALVAFAPGGLEAMTIMAFALDLDPAYVGTHQIARYLCLALALPAVVLVLRRRWRASPD